MSQQLGRLTQRILTNNSGNYMSNGDVGIIDVGAALSVITTSTPADTSAPIAICIEPNGILDGADGMFLVPNVVDRINLDGSASIGDFISTSSTDGQGTPHAAPQAAGDFAMALDTGTNPPAIMLGGVASGGGSALTVEDSGMSPVVVTDVNTMRFREGAVVDGGGGLVDIGSPLQVADSGFLIVVNNVTQLLFDVTKFTVTDNGSGGVTIGLI